MSHTPVESLRTAQTAELDPVTAYWENYEPGKGLVTLVCWGSAWSCYFGAMSGETIQEFFASAGTDYLVSKLGVTQWLKQTKRHEAYLARVIKAVKVELAKATGGAL